VLLVQIYRRFRETCCQHHPIFLSAAAAAAADDDDDDDKRTSRSAGTLLLDYTVPVPEHNRIRSHSHKNVK